MAEYTRWVAGLDGARVGQRTDDTIRSLKAELRDTRLLDVDDQVGSASAKTGERLKTLIGTAARDPNNTGGLQQPAQQLLLSLVTPVTSLTTAM